MLHFILGRAGSGKTSKLLDKLAALSKQQKKCILMTPEQASFEYEKMIALSDQIDPAYVEVLNFTRLSQLCFNTLGGPKKELITPTGSYLMMTIALEEIKDELSIYKRQYQGHGFISALLRTYEECRNAGVSPEKLSKFSFDLGEGLLKEKSFELSLIFDTYRAILAQSHVDPSDILEIAGQKLQGSGYFAGTTVLFDGFSGFSALQYRIIETMLAGAEDVYFTLCCDWEDQGNETFGTTIATHERLTRLAAAASVTVGDTEVLGASKRSVSPQIRQLEELLCGHKPQQAVEEGRVQFYAAQSCLDELEWVCAKISELLREGYRYKDIAVIPRSLERYAAAIERIFAKYGICYYLDTPRDVRAQVVVKWLLLAAEIGARGCDTELMLEFLKSPMLRLSPRLIAEVENYCYIWSVRGQGWKQPFVNHPDGLVEGMNEQVRERLAAIEGCRRRLLEVLKPFLDKDIIWDGRSFATALYELFSPSVGKEGAVFTRGKKRYRIRNRLPSLRPKELRLVSIKGILKGRRQKRFSPAKENLLAYAGYLVSTNAMSAIEAKIFLEEQSMLWGQICQVLDLFAELLGGVKVSKRKLLELLELSFSTLELTAVPHTLDQVQIGTADRIRTIDTKAVFIIGAVEGEYPLLAAAGGLFSDADRRRMEQQGVELYGDSDELSAKERMFCYQAVSCASEFVYFSYPKSRTGDQGLPPSVLYSAAFEVFGSQGDSDGNRLGRIVNPATAAYQLACGFGEEGALTDTLKAYFLQQGDQRIPTLLEGSRSKPKFQINDRSLTRGLYGTEMRVSPTKIDRFNSCPFSYFVSDGLRLRPRQKAELNHLQSGSVVHMALERIVKTYGSKGLLEVPEEELRGAVDSVIREYLQGRLEDAESLSKRNQYLFMRLSDSIYDLLRRLGEEFAQSSFAPVYFEMPIDGSGDAEPITVETVDGLQISVVGTVDRVDIAEIKGERYVRVVDYKSGGKKFKLSDVFYGLNMQMLIYLFAIWKGGKGDLEDMLPAGVLYMPSLAKYHSTERKDNDDRLKRQKDKHYRMNGLILDDPQVIEAMDINASGIFIPQRTARSAGSFMALEQLGRLYGKVEEQIKTMAEEILDGRAEAMPTVSATQSPCGYCEYFGICGFEEGDAIRHQVDVSLDKLLDLEEVKA